MSETIARKVSVVVPTYNRADLVVPCVESVLAQTYRNVEVIVVDDASTDETEREVRGLSEASVRYVRHTKNRGPSAARNTGIENARGEFVAFLDSDDHWLPEKLEAQVERFSREPDLACVFTGWEWIRPDGSTRVERCPDPASGLIDDRPRWFYNIVQDLMVRTTLARNVPFDEEIRAYENLEWLIRLGHHRRWGFVPEILVRCRDHGSPRASDSDIEKLRGLEYVLSQYRSTLDDHPAELYHLRLTAGALALEGGDAGAREHLIDAVRLRPFALRAWKRLLMTWIAPSRRSMENGTPR